MAAFLKCTDVGGAAILVNFDHVYQIKSITRGSVTSTQLVLTAPSNLTIEVRDPMHSLEQQLMSKS